MLSGFDAPDYRLGRACRLEHGAEHRLKGCSPHLP